MNSNDFADTKFARNSLSGILRILVSTPLLFLIVPFMINELGPKLYGIWTLGSIVISYAGLGDLGLGIAVVKYTAQYSSQNLDEEINKLVNTTVIVFLVIGFCMTFALWLSLNWFINSILKAHVFICSRILHEYNADHHPHTKSVPLANSFIATARLLLLLEDFSFIFTI